MLQPRLIPRPSHASKPTAPTPRTYSTHKKTISISTSSILKRKAMATIPTSRQRLAHRRHRDKDVHPLVQDYQDDNSKCRADAESRAVAAFAGAHAGMLARVGVVKNSNAGLLESLEVQNEAAVAPLGGMEVGDTTTGKTEEVAGHVERFRAELRRGEEELERLWGVWNETQREIEGMAEEGYKDVMKGWEEEVKGMVVEMEREVEEAGREAVRGMGEAEKEIDRKLREDQAKLVAMMFGEE